MSKITSSILKSVAPKTPVPKRDRFLPELNKLLPHFEINSELRVSAFLATCAIESDYFRTTSEYGKGRGKAYGRVHKDTGKAYYGRGIIQNTWREGYEDFTAYVGRNWSWLKPLSGINAPAPDFVENPDLLTFPFFAVLGACWFWHANKLNKLADGGTKNFFAIQGLVNRGSAKKRALDYEKRIVAYEVLRRTLPDNFSLSLSTETSAFVNRPASNPSQISVDNPPNQIEDFHSPVEEIQDGAADSKFQGAGAGGSFDEEKAKVEIAPDGGIKVETSKPADDTPVNESATTETVAAPPKENAVKHATTITFLGFTFSGVLAVAIEAMTKAIADGFVSAQQIGEIFLNFVVNNTKYFFMLIGLIIFLMIVKKVCKQITLWLQMWFASRKDLNNVEVKPQ